MAVSQVPKQSTSTGLRASDKAVATSAVSTVSQVGGPVVELLPERLISGLARANARTKGRFDTFKNVVVSNVPGPREPRYLGRWRVDQWFSTGQISHGATLNMTVWSYCDQFNLCVMADAVAVRNTWELVGGFRASHEELLAAARAQATPKEMAT